MSTPPRIATTRPRRQPTPSPRELAAHGPRSEGLLAGFLLALDSIARTIRIR